ncbi:MAG: Fic family protein [Verrucomicrobia bacterium]|nr:Fic family protein [Verrucomicrobiota bacterium]
MRIPESPPPLDKLIARLKDPSRMKLVFEAQADLRCLSRYFHWDELKHRSPPKGCTHEDWWLALKFQRMGNQRRVPLRDKADECFAFGMPEVVVELLHQIDRNGGTLIEIPEPVTNPEERDRYLVRSLMEEAITSSQLEGAATTREVAKKMLAEGRKPRDRSERMIVNNYLTMQRIMEWKDSPLTPELVFQVHREISGGTLDIADGVGRLRLANENINVSDMEGNVFHTPPPAGELAKRLELMCDFANAKSPDYFIHPVVRGIILHFWLAYDHPFVDGNGRTARALFYWLMLHSGYWLFEFISISQILRKAPVQYGTAFLHTETDDNDLTYFIIHQAEVIKKALIELHDYVARKSKETRATMAVLQGHPDLNHRQQAVLAHAIRHPGFSYNIAGHMARHGIAYDTARLDLLGLAERGLLEQRKAGKALAFTVPVDLEQRLRIKGVRVGG